jgi:hypothetical protein
MRLWLTLIVLAPAVFAQQPPSPPSQTRNFWHFQPPPGWKPFAVTPPSAAVVVAESRPKRCSIPLLNLLPDRPNRAPDRMAVPPPPKERFPTTFVPLPAPPCDDKKR